MLPYFRNQFAEAEKREIALEKLVALTGESRDDLLRQWRQSPEYFWDFYQRKVSSAAPACAP